MNLDRIEYKVRMKGKEETDDPNSGTTTLS